MRATLIFSFHAFTVSLYFLILSRLREEFFRNHPICMEKNMLHVIIVFYVMTFALASQVCAQQIDPIAPQENYTPD